MAKKVIVKVSYGWAGTPVDVSNFITSAEDENEIEDIEDGNE